VPTQNLFQSILDSYTCNVSDTLDFSLDINRDGYALKASKNLLKTSILYRHVSQTEKGTFEISVSSSSYSLRRKIITTTSNSQQETTRRECIVEIPRSHSCHAFFSEIVSQSRMCWTCVTVRRRWLGEMPRSTTRPRAKWTRAIVLGNALIALIGQCTDAPKHYKPTRWPWCEYPDIVDTWTTREKTLEQNIFCCSFTLK